MSDTDFALVMCEVETGIVLKEDGSWYLRGQERFRPILDSSEVLGSIYLCSGICLGETVSYTKSFTTLGTTTTTLLDQGEVQLTRSPGDIGILNLNGLGVTGGGVDSSVDGSEVLTLTFVNLAVSDLIYNVASAGNLNGNGTVGDASVEAFGLDGASLGVFALSLVGFYNLSAVFSNSPITRVEITADTDNHRVSGLNFSRCE